MTTPSNRGAASDLILLSKASGPQKLILQVYLQCQRSDEPPATASSFPGLTRCAQAASIGEKPTRQWRALLIDAGVLALTEARPGRTSAYRIDWPTLVAYQPPRRLPATGKRTARAARAKPAAPPGSNPSRNPPPLPESARGGIRHPSRNPPGAESAPGPLPESAPGPLPESAPRSSCSDPSPENLPQFPPAPHGSPSSTPGSADTAVSPRAPARNEEPGRGAAPSLIPSLDQGEGALARWASRKADKAGWASGKELQDTVVACIAAVSLRDVDPASCGGEARVVLKAWADWGGSLLTPDELRRRVCAVATYARLYAKAVDDGTFNPNAKGRGNEAWFPLRGENSTNVGAVLAPQHLARRLELAVAQLTRGGMRWDGAEWRNPASAALDPEDVDQDAEAELHDLAEELVAKVVTRLDGLADEDRLRKAAAAAVGHRWRQLAKGDPHLLLQQLVADTRSRVKGAA